MSTRTNGSPSARPAREVPAQRDAGRVAASLERIAELHRDLAGAYCELARDLHIQLADLADRSDLSLMSNTTPAPVTAQPERDFVCQQELADLLGCQPRTVRRMELRGELPPATYLSDLKRWRRDEIQAWLEENRPAQRSSRR